MIYILRTWTTIMGVELRNFQRKFQILMRDVKPQIKPRIVVWLDERLAEFKIKGSMQLTETLDDPKWIKDYYTSKRESKAVAIKEREAREGTSNSSLVQPKVEQHSESSNGVAHPYELGEPEKEEKLEDICRSPKKVTPVKIPESEGTATTCQLVEVKHEQIVDEDDDMIITGESIAPHAKQTQYYNPMKQLYSGFQRKRQRFGSSLHRPLKTSRFKPNVRSTSVLPGSNSQFLIPSQSATSQSSYTSMPSSQSFHSQSYSGETQSYEEESPSYAADSQPFTNELLRIPPHLQAEAAALQSQEQLDYEVTESDMYDEYGDQSYDSSFLTEGESSIVYDEEGNAMLKGQNVGDESSMDPVPGTSSDAASSQGRTPIRREKPPVVLDADWIMVEPGSRRSFRCRECSMQFLTYLSIQRHVKLDHFKRSKFVCPECDRCFIHADNLDGHINSVHYQIRPHVCECGKAYFSRSNLRVHGKRCALSAYRIDS